MRRPNPKKDKYARRPRNPLPVLGHHRLARNPAPCKKCGEEPRLPGTGHCATCTAAYRQMVYDKQRLQDKNNNQITK